MFTSVVVGVDLTNDSGDALSHVVARFPERGTAISVGSVSDCDGTSTRLSVSVLCHPRLVDPASRGGGRGIASCRGRTS